MVCLDTDFLIAILRGDEKAIKKQKELEGARTELYTTLINAHELFKGAYRSKKPIESLRIVDDMLENVRLLNFDLHSSRLTGEIAEELKRKGTRIGELDVLIAGIALAHNEKLITKNTREFSRIPSLKIESW